MANGNTIIPHGLRADLMRKHMEDKNTLTKKGSLYIGTGIQYNGGAPDYFGTEKCYKTAELEPIDTAGVPLVSRGLAGNQVQLGIEWAPLKTAGVGNQAIVGVAGTSVSNNNHNSKIYYNSIGNNDIAESAIANSKLVNNAIKIGTSIFSLTQHVSGPTSPATDSLTGIQRVSANEFVGGTVNGTIITASDHFNATSDRRLKTNIKEYTTNNSILDVPVMEFDYKATGSHNIGFIAQDLQKLFPELVNVDSNGYLGISETKLVYLLMLEVKKLKERIEELEG